MLERFADKVGAPHFAKWEGFNEVVASDTIKGLLPFIEKNLHQADKIHFNLDEFRAGSYKKFVNKHKGTLTELTPRNIVETNVTNWEFHKIVNNNDLLNKTTFYGAEGRVLSKQEVAQIVDKANRSRRK